VNSLFYRIREKYFLVHRRRFDRVGRRNPYLRLLLEAQWWNPEKLAAFQLEKLRSLLAHAEARVPHYRKTFAERGFAACRIESVEDLQALPVLTKTTIQENLEALLSADKEERSYYANRTGGSTGNMLSFYQDHGYSCAGLADLQRNFFWCGFRPCDPHVYLWGSDTDSREFKTVRSVARGLLVPNTLWINAFDIRWDALPFYACLLGWFKPRFIYGYVSVVMQFVRYLGENGIRNIRPQAVQTTAEVLLPEHRELIRDVLGCPVFNRYGCREVGNIAHECGAHEGLHVLGENNLVEILKLESDEPASIGEVGRIVVTNLNNYVMPFIRYEVGDLGRFLGKRCSCGRGLPLMDVDAGRVSDMIISPGGKWIHGEFFTHLFYKIPEVRQFQVTQADREHLRILVVPGPGLRTEVLKRLEDEIRACGDPGFVIETRIVDRIPCSPSGKFQFVTSARKGDS
jgi:phenylacetate-CoA ligase